MGSTFSVPTDPRLHANLALIVPTVCLRLGFAQIALLAKLLLIRPAQLVPLILSPQASSLARHARQLA